MSVAKSGALPNSYRFFTISVDSFDNRMLKGRIFHDTIKEGVSFESLLGMALVLEGLFDKLQYPMKSVESRSFNRRIGVPLAETVLYGSRQAGSNRPGDLADFRLHVKHRLHASWQGEITDLRDGSAASFISFMEIMEYLECTLGQKPVNPTLGLGKRMCQISVRCYDKCTVRGDVSHPALEERWSFINEFELKEKIEYLTGPLPEGEDEYMDHTPRTLRILVGSFGGASFTLRLLFKCNGTWQGILCWKEKRGRVSFRSFLEMLILIYEAVNNKRGWTDDSEEEASVIVRGQR